MSVRWTQQTKIAEIAPTNLYIRVRTRCFILSHTKVPRWLYFLSVFTIFLCVSLLHHQSAFDVLLFRIPTNSIVHFVCVRSKRIHMVLAMNCCVISLLPLPAEEAEFHMKKNIFFSLKIFSIFRMVLKSMASMFFLHHYYCWGEAKKM